MTNVPFADSLGDNLVALMPENEDEFVNIYETDEFKELAEYMYQWNQEGFILEDAMTTQESADTYLKNGRAFAYIELGSQVQDMENKIKVSTGHEVIYKKLTAPFITTNVVNNASFGISVTSEHAEASMKFLNEMFTNEKVMNLFAYGIENVHWEEKEEGIIGYPEGSKHRKYSVIL